MSPLLRACVLTVVASMVLLDGAAHAGRAPASPVNDETIREVQKSLEASSVEVVPLDRYALFALDALADLEPCLARKGEGATLVLRCGERSARAPWPPSSSDEVVKLIGEALQLTANGRAVKPDAVKVVCRALARATSDPYTAYLPPELVAAITTSRPALFSATPGIEVWPRDPLKIREVRRASDAAANGVAAGDRIAAIDGKSTAGLTLPEITTRLQGADDSVVSLLLKTPTGERTVRVSRSLFADSDVQVVELDDGVIYVRVPLFKAGVARAVAVALWDGRPSGVILDLRHNGGGLVPEGIALADLFISEGDIAAVRGRGGRLTEEYPAHRDAKEISAPLVVLIDGSSASASELVSMALKESRRARLLGATTAGKGSVQFQIQLPDGGVLKVTTGYYVGPEGRRLPETGLEPHRFLSQPSSRTVLDGADPKKDGWVQAALDELRGPRGDGLVRASTGPEP
ncbi:MAG: hypothetical protein IT383_28130 [Deltaproteobacteria bacterium]|nr:hypothetical protein [Deltaproteobacteria bacterium]